MTEEISFKDIGIDKHFVWNEIRYRKVIQTQDTLGTYNAISYTAPLGSKVVWLGENTIVKKVEK